MGLAMRINQCHWTDGFYQKTNFSKTVFNSDEICFYVGDGKIRLSAVLFGEFG